jgi:hypothetical protein
MHHPHFRWIITLRTSAANGWMRLVALPLALVALLALASRGTFERLAAAAEPQRAGKGQPQARRGPCPPDPLPPSFGFWPVAEFVITGAEFGEPGESFVPAGGDGTFESGNNIFGLDIVDGVDVDDLDGDGDLDFLIADGRFGHVYLYRNDGQGTFEPERIASGVTTPFFTLLGNSTNLRIADFNRDGLPDFVVGDLRIERGTKIYLQDRRGKFRISDILDTSWNDAPFGEEGPFILGVAVGDMNGDGLVDITMLGYEGEGAGEVRLYLGKGRGRFSEPMLLFNLEEDFGFNLNATGLAAFDLERDGDFDLVVGAGDGNHYVYLNNGAGAFTAPAAPAFVVGGQSGIDAYDADHDGDHDLVLVTVATSQLFYVQNLGGTLASPAPVSPVAGFGVAVGAPPIPLTAPQPAR